VGFFLDAGVAFQGPPSVELTSATGLVAQADLDAEITDFEDDISFFKYYPVVTLGLSFAFSIGQ
jgi:hypothetical protein